MNENIRALFRHVAEAQPRALAIDRGGRTVSYGELEMKVSRLAAVLRDGAVGPGSVVGLFLSDPIEVITGILAVLEVGGIFCPLDPEFPEQRLVAMTSQVTPGLYVSTSRGWGRLERLVSGASRAPRIVLLDDRPVDANGFQIVRSSEGPDADSEPRPLVPFDGDAACSLYFTSGSTGRPKAILGRLKGIAHFVRWEAELLGVDRGTRVSQLAAAPFDGFLKDAFVPLCAGGVVCAPESRSLILEPARLIDWIDIEGIEILHCVPTILRAILAERPRASYFAELRWVVLAGEVVHPSDVRRMHEIFGERIRLLNLYGPTETTVTKLFYPVEPGDRDRATVPIGKAMPGAEVLLVDSRGRACRQGMVGEIYLRTPYRALGYFEEPELTDLAYVPNPLNDDPEDIVYRTGDFARLLPDGHFEFLGRRDQQVKIRGVRIEMDEVEGLLRSRPGVRDAAVVDREDAEGNKQLCAYLVLDPGVTVAAVRETLAEHLPSTMTPSVVVALDELPRTLNGKIDRRALPSLEQLRAERETDGDAAPQTPVEEILAGIWAEVLRLPQVGRDDAFFELGGHSLLATQILARIRHTFAVELLLRDLFEAPTVAQLAQRVEQALAAGSTVVTEPIPRVPRDGELPLSYSQQRMWMLEQLSAGSSAFHIPIGLRLMGALSVTALEQTFAEIIRRHEILRTRFPARDGLPRQVIEPAHRLPMPWVDLRSLPSDRGQEELRRIAAAELRRRFDLETGPLVRIALARLGADEHVLIGALHHMVGDAWSFDILVREITLLYDAFVHQRPSPLPELEIQYADVASWQRRWLTGPVLDKRLAYWRRQLEGAPEQLALPQSRRRSSVQTFRGHRLPVIFSPQLTSELRALSRHEGTTLYMTLLTAFLVLLSKYSGQEDLVVGSVIANRERTEVEALIGFLANTLVLRFDLSGNPTVSELLARVRDVCLGAYTHQLPPEKLLEDSGQTRADHRLFDVWFQLETARRERLELAGIEWEPFETERAETRFELSLVLEEDEHQVRGEMEVDAELFDTDMVLALLEHLESVVVTMSAHPQTPIGDLSLASRQDLDLANQAWNAPLEL